MTINESIYAHKVLDLNHPTNHTKQDHFSVLPYEIVLHIFSYLSVGDLSRSMGVSKQWRQFGKEDVLWSKFDLLDLNATFSSKLGPIQDKSAVMWEISDKDPSQATKLSGYELFKLLTDCVNGKAKLPITNNAGVTVITMPRGVTLNKIINFMHEEGIRIFRDQIPSFWKLLDDQPNPHTYTFVMTNGFFEESENESKKPLNERMSKFNSDLPTITEAIAYFMTLSLSNPQKQEQLQGSLNKGKDSLRIFACCPTIKKHFMVVGREGIRGVHVQTLSFYSVEQRVRGVWRKEHPVLPSQPS